MKRRAFPFRTKQRSGISLTELIIVLGISSLLMGGAFAWLNSRGGVNFYDQMRQIESSIREIETESQTNLVQGGDGTDCRDADDRGSGTSCPIGRNEEAFASAVAIQKASTDTVAEQIRIYHLKTVAPTPSTNPIVQVVEYGVPRIITLPMDIRSDGFTIRSSGTGCNLAANSVNESAATPGSGNWSAVVFRKQPNAIYSFTGGGSNINSGGTPFDFDGGVTSPDASFGGNYVSYGPIGNTLVTMPCVVVWQFVSLEKVAGVPRYKGEIVFNLVNQTVRLQTH